MLKYELVPVTDFQQNCTLLFDETTMDGVIIDPGGEVDRIKQAVNQLGLNVKEIWLTHGHLDHAGGAMEAKENFAVSIVGPHKADKMLLDNIEVTSMNYGYSGMKNATPDRWLEEGERLSIGDHQFEVFHCPGHAPGHVIYVQRESRLIIMGDVLFQGSVGRTDLPGGDHATLMSSLRDKVMSLDDDMEFICGHGPGSTIGEEKKTNPFLLSLQ